jgi:hypothetical protein
MSFVASSVLGCVLAHAQTPLALSIYLPAEPLVKEALINSPLMDMARSKKNAGIARAQSIDAGAAEFTLRSTIQRRQDQLLNAQLHESMLSIERPIRMWGKRAIDTKLSKQTQEFVDIEYADAMHEGTRELMRYWFAYLRALVDEKIAQTNLDLALKMRRLTQIQFKQGEVSQLDEQLASAEYERVSAARKLVHAQLQSSAAVFSERYPQVKLPLELPEPIGSSERSALPVINESLLAMRQEFLEKNHELNMMRIDAKRFNLVAERASKDRMPDPTVGVFTARERSGTEAISGVLFSMPLAGAARESHARAALADAQAASDKVRLAEQQLGASFDSMWIQFQSKRDAAQGLQMAWKAQAQAADKSLKAYALGEGSLSQVLLTARFASENLSAAEHMNLEVLELLALIRLDLHQMWDFDE